MTPAQLDAIPLTTTFNASMQEERDLLFSHQTEILGALTRETASAPAPPAPPSVTPPDARYFYRVTCRQVDTNGNGLMDWFEAKEGYAAFLDKEDSNAATTSKIDEVTNLTLGQKQARSTPPGSTAAPSSLGITPTDEDLDGDGVSDDQEAIANDPNFTYPRTPETPYAAVWLDFDGHKNYDDSNPELVTMNDLGQLFFDYYPAPPPTAPPGSPPDHRVLVYDSGVFSVMDPIMIGTKTKSFTLQGAKASSFSGGSLVFKVAGLNTLAATNPTYPYDQFADRYYILKKTDNWKTAQMGELADPGEDGALDPAHIADPSNNTDYLKPVENSLTTYDNLGNAIVGAYVETRGHYTSNDESEFVKTGTGRNLAVLKGSGLATGDPGSDDAYTTIMHDFSDLMGVSWTTMENDYSNATISTPSSNGRVRIQTSWWHNVEDEEDNVSDHPTEYEDRRSVKWYEGIAGDPFKNEIFIHAPETAASVNSWSKETRPASGSKAPYRQGPLFITSNGELATMVSDSTNGWHILGAEYGPPESIVSGGAIINDRAEILEGWWLWRNNHRVDLSSYVDASKPSGYPGGVSYATSYEKALINNKGQVVYSMNKFYDGHWHHFTVLLVAIELKQPVIDSDGTVGDLVSVIAVRFCRWNSPRQGGAGMLANPTEFPKEDPDRIIFSVLIPGKTGAGPLKIHVSTTGAENTPSANDADYNDDGADVDLIEKADDPGVFESKPIALVADQDDDTWQGGRVAGDGALNDPTFIGWPGGKLKIKVPDLSNAEIEYPIKKFSHGFKVAYVMAGDMAGQFVNLSISENQRRLKEIYAPLLERVSAPNAPPTPISQADLQAIVGTDNEIQETEVDALIAKVHGLGLPAGAIKIVFVSPTVGFGSVGGENQARNGRRDIVFCFLKQLAQDAGFAKLASDTAAHECGHALRGADHREDGGIFDYSAANFSAFLPAWHLMALGSTSNHILLGAAQDAPRSGKHWYLRDEEIVRTQNTFSKKIP